MRALLGGALIGLSGAILLLVHGRIAGVSGIVEGALDDRRERGWRLLFLLGLVGAGAALATIFPAAFPVHGAVSPRLLVAAGLLVGFGARLGNGCTSGHGVCGLGRMSKRGLVATLTFMTTGAVAVYVLRHVIP